MAGIKSSQFGLGLGDISFGRIPEATLEQIRLKSPLAENNVVDVAKAVGLNPYDGVYSPFGFDEDKLKSIRADVRAGRTPVVMLTFQNGEPEGRKRDVISGILSDVDGEVDIILLDGASAGADGTRVGADGHYIYLNVKKSGNTFNINAYDTLGGAEAPEGGYPVVVESKNDAEEGVFFNLSVVKLGIQSNSVSCGLGVPLIIASKQKNGTVIQNEVGRGGRALPAGEAARPESSSADEADATGVVVISNLVELFGHAGFPLTTDGDGKGNLDSFGLFEGGAISVEYQNKARSRGAAEIKFNDEVIKHKDYAENPSLITRNFLKRTDLSVEEKNEIFEIVSATKVKLNGQDVTIGEVLQDVEQASSEGRLNSYGITVDEAYNIFNTTANYHKDIYPVNETGEPYIVESGGFQKDMGNLRAQFWANLMPTLTANPVGLFLNYPHVKINFPKGVTPDRDVLEFNTHRGNIESRVREGGGSDRSSDTDSDRGSYDGSDETESVSSRSSSFSDSEIPEGILVSLSYPEIIEPIVPEVNVTLFSSFTKERAQELYAPDTGNNEAKTPLELTRLEPTKRTVSSTEIEEFFYWIETLGKIATVTKDPADAARRKIETIEPKGKPEFAKIISEDEKELELASARASVYASRMADIAQKLANGDASVIGAANNLMKEQHDFDKVSDKAKSEAAENMVVAVGLASGVALKSDSANLTEANKALFSLASASTAHLNSDSLRGKTNLSEDSLNTLQTAFTSASNGTNLTDAEKAALIAAKNESAKITEKRTASLRGNQLSPLSSSYGQPKQPSQRGNRTEWNVSGDVGALLQSLPIYDGAEGVALKGAVESGTISIKQAAELDNRLAAKVDAKNCAKVYGIIEAVFEKTAPQNDNANLALKNTRDKVETSAQNVGFTTPIHFGAKEAKGQNTNCVDALTTHVESKQKADANAQINAQRLAEQGTTLRKVNPGNVKGDNNQEFQKSAQMANNLLQNKPINAVQGRSSVSPRTSAQLQQLSADQLAAAAALGESINNANPEFPISSADPLPNTKDKGRT